MLDFRPARFDSPSFLGQNNSFEGAKHSYFGWGTIFKGKDTSSRSSWFKLSGFAVIVKWNKRKPSIMVKLVAA